MSADEASQLERICNALLQYQQQQHVPATQLRAALTVEQYKRFKDTVLAPTTSVDMLDKRNRPAELMRYVQMLKTADSSNARADRAAVSKKLRYINGKAAVDHWRDKSVSEYEDANLYLEESLQCSDAQKEQLMRAWLDRPFDLTPSGEIDFDCAGVARVIGSKSKYCRIILKTQREVRQEKWINCAKNALLHAVQELIYVPIVLTTEQSAKLSGLLAKLKH